jgi:putative FmdB family regulatory protein
VDGITLTIDLIIMPTYDYQCRRCGHEFEKVQRISDPARARCPKCRGAAERRITGGAGLLFKGGGFYITDYRSESYKKAAKAESGEGPTPASEVKPEKTHTAPTAPAAEAPKAAKRGNDAKPGKRGRRAD